MHPHYACGMDATEHMCYDLFRIVESCMFVTTFLYFVSECCRYFAMFYIVLFEYNFRNIHYLYFFKDINT